MMQEVDSHGVWHTNMGDERGEAESLNLLEDHTGLQDWRVPAIFSAIFCFFPTGIVAIYSALKARKSRLAKDDKAWKKYNGQARFFVFLTVLLGVILYGTVIGVLQTVSREHDVT